MNLLSMQEYKVLEYVEIDDVGKFDKDQVVRLDPKVAKDFVEAGFLAEHKEEPKGSPERKPSVGLAVSYYGDGVKNDATITQVHPDGLVDVKVAYEKDAEPVFKGRIEQGRALGQWDFKG